MDPNTVSDQSDLSVQSNVGTIQSNLGTIRSDLQALDNDELLHYNYPYVNEEAKEDENKVTLIKFSKSVWINVWAMIVFMTVGMIVFGICLCRYCEYCECRLKK